MYAGLEGHFKGQRIREIILGAQDGLVNVLGLVLGVASATNNASMVLVAGLAATFAETISMAAVAYTSAKAEFDYYQSEYSRERREVEEMPEVERKEIWDIYYAKGFRGQVLNEIVNQVCLNKDVWIETMMLEELKLSPVPKINPLSSFGIVFISTLLGSLVPVAPFTLLPASLAMPYAITASMVALFMLGVLKARKTIGGWPRSGLESVLVGMAAAIVGYLIGALVGQLTGISVVEV